MAARKRNKAQHQGEAQQAQAQQLEAQQAGATPQAQHGPDKDTQPGQPLDSQEVRGHVLTHMDLGHWAGTRPAYLDRPTGMDHLTDWQLHSRLMDLNPWQGTPEYAERVYRLVHGLTEFLLPNNMAVA